MLLNKGLIRSHQSTISFLQRLSDVTLVASTLKFSLWLTNYYTSWDNTYSVVALSGALLYYLLAELNGMYTSWRVDPFVKELKTLLWTWLWVVLFFLLFAFSTKISETYSRQAILTWFILTPLSLSIWRLSIKLFLRKLRQLGFNKRNIGIVGVNNLARQVIYNIQKNPWTGLDVTNIYDQKLKSETIIDSFTITGDFSTLVDDCKEGKLDSVYITLPLSNGEEIKNLLNDLSDTAVTVYLVPDLFMFELLHSQWENLEGMPVISIYGTPLHGLGGVLKRSADIILSLFILFIISIPLFLIAIGIKLTSKGPVLFKQSRYGLGGEEFTVWKFRSMTVSDKISNHCQQATRNDPRVTKFGAFLRKTSLDELPQFINVLQGRMSIVGPRPHPVKLNEEFRSLIPKYMLRHIVKPGITGWAQINGFRGETDTLDKMENRIRCDLFYIENWSLWFDMKIMVLTIFKGFLNKNAY